MAKVTFIGLGNMGGPMSSIPMGSLARNLFQLHAGQGNGDLDFSSIIRLYKPD